MRFSGFARGLVTGVAAGALVAIAPATPEAQAACVPVHDPGGVGRPCAAVLSDPGPASGPAGRRPA